LYLIYYITDIEFYIVIINWNINISWVACKC